MKPTGYNTLFHIYQQQKTKQKKTKTKPTATAQFSKCHSCKDIQNEQKKRKTFITTLTHTLD